MKRAMNSQLKKRLKFKNQRQRVIALFFLFTFLNTLVPYNVIYANNGGPRSPEAASFEPVDATDMVNLATGDFTYVLPLIEVPSPEGSYPIVLSYRGGVVHSQESSWVGLGWNLNPGAINRTLSGAPDDFMNWRSERHMYDEGKTRFLSSHSLSYSSSSGYSASINMQYLDGKSIGGVVSLGYQGIGVSQGYGANSGQGGVSLTASASYGKLLRIGAQATTSVSWDGKVSSSSSVSASALGADYTLSSSGDSSVGISLLGLPRQNLTRGFRGISTGAFGSFTRVRTPEIPLAAIGDGVLTYQYGVDITKQIHDKYNTDYSVGFLHYDKVSNPVVAGGKICEYTITKTTRLLAFGNLGGIKTRVKTERGRFYLDGVYVENGNTNEEIIAEIKDNHPWNQSFMDEALGDFYEVDYSYSYEIYDADTEFYRVADVSEVSLGDEGNILDDRKANLILPNRDMITVSAQGLMGGITPRVSLDTNSADEGYEIPYLHSDKGVTFDSETGEAYVISYPNNISTSSTRSTNTQEAGTISSDCTATVPGSIASYFSTHNRSFDTYYKYFFNNDYSSVLDINSSLLSTVSTTEPYSVFVDDNNASNDGDTYTKRSGKYIETYNNYWILHKYFLDRGICLNTANVPPAMKNFMYPVVNNKPYLGVYEDMLSDPGLENGDLTTIGAYSITTLDGKTYHYSLPVYNNFSIQRSYDLENTGKSESESFYDITNDQKYATHWLLTAITGPDYIDTNGNSIVDEEDYGYWFSFEYGLYSAQHGWKTPQDQAEIDKNRAYVIGSKQVYYLDRVRSRTHTAFFIKDDRTDGGGRTINYSAKTSAKAVTATRTIESSDAYRLKEILLVKNSKVKEVAKSEINYVSVSNTKKDNNITNTSYDYLQNDPLHNRLCQLDYKDTTVKSGFWRQLRSEASKSVYLEHDYSLSTRNGLSNLTLNSVRFGGKKGLSTMPPYSFEYGWEGANRMIRSHSITGYNINSINACSLTEITTPTGAEIAIQYEEDEYENLLIERKRVFGKDLKYYMYKDDSDVLYCDVEKKDGDHEFESDFSFTDYFEVGTTRLRLWRKAIKRDDHGLAGVCKRHGGEYKVVEKDDTEVTAVTADKVTLKLNDYEFNQGPREDRNTPLNSWFEATDEAPWFEFYDRPVSPYCSEKFDEGQNAILYGNKKPKNDEYDKLGIRVKKLEVIGDDFAEMEQRYTYSKGVLSYIPYTDGVYEAVSYLDMLPGPTVLYGKVTKQDVFKKYFTDVAIDGYEEYEFNTLEPRTETETLLPLDENGFQPKLREISFGPYLKFTSTVIDAYDLDDSGVSNGGFAIGSTPAELNTSKIYNKMAYVGQLKNMKIYNKEGQVIYTKNNVFRDQEAPKLGYVNEAYDIVKQVKNEDETFTVGYALSSVQTLEYPYELERTIENVNGQRVFSEIMEYDEDTGLVLSTKVYNSSGVGIKNSYGYAHMMTTIINSNETKVYERMGSKYDDINNKNMLSQKALVAQDIVVDGIENRVSASITTWSPYYYYDDVNNEANDLFVYRKYQEYEWDGSLNSFGYFDYAKDGVDPVTGTTIYTDDGFEWDNTRRLASEPTKWKRVKDYTKYNNYSKVLETEGINNSYSAMKMTDEESKISAVCNSKYEDMYYASCEAPFLDTSIPDEGEVFYSEGTRVEYSDTENKVHTGTWSIQADQNKTAFELRIPTDGNLNTYRKTKFDRKYKFSVWTHKNTVSLDSNGDMEENCKFDIDGTAQSVDVFEPMEFVKAGDWVLLTGEIQLPETTSEGTIVVKLISNASGALFDDFRLYPVGSTMVSYVYNEWDELSYITNDNGLSTYYFYDEAGRLEETSTEVIDDDSASIIGGFKRVNKSTYNYKK